MIKIGIAGKGGTGKTTLSALIILVLLRHNKKPILAVDADPNSNLNEVLGIPAPESLVDIVDRVSKEKDRLPPGMEKSKYLEFQIREAIQEEEEFDLLLMGKTEGPGCYCYANHLLRDFMEKLEKNYSFVVMDNEAGMEHLSRRTSRNLDFLFITSLCDKISIKSAERIYSMVEKLELEIKEIYLVLNEFGGRKISENYNPFLPPFFVLPYDEKIAKLTEEGKGIFSLSSDSKAYKIVEEHILPLIE
ncbi:AAA family ATPase [bacterium]|nr:AAA family ATPase [bacterium]